MTCIDDAMRLHDFVPLRSAVWCCDGAANLWTIKIELLYMLWSQYKLAAMKNSEFLCKQITCIPNFANRNSDFLTSRNRNFKKNNQNFWNQKRNWSSASDGAPRNWNEKLKFPTKFSTILPVSCIGRQAWPWWTPITATTTLLTQWLLWSSNLLGYPQVQSGLC
jgi:hypothetical protein